MSTVHFVVPAEPRRPGETERRQRLRPSDLPRTRRQRVAGDQARRTRVRGRGPMPRAEQALAPTDRRHRGRSRRADRRPDRLHGARHPGPRGGPAAAGRSRSHVPRRGAARPPGRRMRRPARVPCCVRRPVTSSPRVRGPGTGSCCATRCRRTRFTWPSPASTPPGLASGTDRGGELLCVAAVTAHKGHDVLLAALAAIADLPWRCVCVGTLDREPAFVEGLRHRAEQAGIADRVCFLWPADRRRPRPRVRRGRRAGARLARRDVRHGGHRGAGSRAAGHRDGGRRAAGGSGPDGATAVDPASWCRPVTARRWRPRCAAG